MKLSKSLNSFAEGAKKDDTYWIEKIKLDFAVDLERRRRALGMTSAEFAKELGVSRAYVSKVSRGDANLTIESMVKLARAAGGKVSLSVVDEQTADRQQRSQWWAHAARSAPAANHDVWRTAPSDMRAIASEEVRYG